MADEEISDLVAGEKRSDLVRALSYVSMEDAPDGGTIVNGDLPPDIAPAFVRAIMRIEAELLLNDAELVTIDQGEPRTPEERRTDALIALLLRVDDRLVR
ncbi:hypothetical protein AB0L82_40250 [Nocardia sp. NPDC052001]|uniref:hypothetical protein n=1 Tax=unclassified Nocardia TaxID=2637762 RepID=UPI003435F7A9